MTRLQHSLFLLLSTSSLLLADSAQAANAVSTAPQNVTFTKDIAPLVYKNCAACHRPGEVAPFSLLTYHDVQKRAKQIAEVTSTRQMPPWKAVEGHGEFRGARRLAEADIALLKQWAQAGMPEGDPKDLPPAPQFKTGWQLGEPDLVVTMPKAYEVPADGRDIYRNFVIPVEIPPGKFINAVEYRPGNRRVVHHAGLAYETTGKCRALDGKDGAPGFTNVGISGQLFPGESGFWVPGKETRPLPEGVSFAWPKGADFLLQLHLHPSGKPETERSTIGFHFTSERPRRSLGGMMLLAGGILIPAGEKAYHTHVEQTLKTDAELYGIFPHMHLIGKEVKVTAVLPDGSSKSLLQIDQWDFNWQSYYEYAKPVFLPRGTKVMMDNTHDNSAENPANPNHPPKVVTAGEQTINEMSAVLIQFFPKGTPIPTTSPAAVAAGGAQPKANPASYLDEAKEVIRRFDKDGDGKLSLEEIQQIPGAGANIAEVVKRFDRDGDGKLSVEELADAIATLKPH
jgi:mono/diheme cytochrome c family protein